MDGRFKCDYIPERKLNVPYGTSSTAIQPLGGLEVEEEYGRPIDLGNGEDVNLIKNVARKVDILVDYLHGSRLEQVGLDPKEMLRANSKLIVARITGRLHAKTLSLEQNARF